MTFSRSQWIRQSGMQICTWASICLYLAGACLANTPVLKLTSKTVFKEGEVSPRENAVYVRRQGLEMMTPSARSADNGRTWTAFRPKPDFDGGLRKGFRRGIYPIFVDPVEDRLVTLVLSLDVADL